MNLTDLKHLARTLFLEGVRAADPKLAVQRALTAEPLKVNPEGRLLVIAFGKASVAMIQQALQHIPAAQRIEAIAVTNYENAREIDGCRVMAAGHPLPDQNGIEAGTAVMDLLRSATKSDQVLCLISGGGSALLPTPRDGLTLADKIKVSEILLESGFDIEQMNRIRQHLSVLKGGGLLELAHPAKVRSLIISDVVGDDLEIIASGPTVPASVGGNPCALLNDKGVWDAMPGAAKTLLKTPRDTSNRSARDTLICTNGQCLNAIASSALDWSPQIVTEPLVGDVRDAAKSVLDCIRSQPKSARQLIIWGGETTVEINGNGMGGRNQELAVRFAELASDLTGEWVFLSGGTDGRDGPTNAAGGIVDRQTIAQAQTNNINVAAALEDNDSHRVLDNSNGLLKTGATGTNVADIQIFLRMG
jgi:hydroxypyruvate reductase